MASTAFALVAGARGPLLGRRAPLLNSWPIRTRHRTSRRSLGTVSLFGDDSLLPAEDSAVKGRPDYWDVPEDTWTSLMTVEKSLKVAVELENYQLAARLRDEQTRLSESLPLQQRYLLEVVRNLRSSRNREDRAEAITTLGEMGSSYDAVPVLAEVLQESGQKGDREIMELASEAMWKVFLKSSNPRVGSLMETGTRFIQVGDLKGALGIFNEMIRIEPSFAEGYNKRATVSYLLHQFEDSVEDCQRVLDIEPLHFGALSGMGLCLLKMGDLEGALQAFERTLQVHPGLTEIRKMAEDLRVRLEADP